jgi:hypothetical protein
VPKPAQPSVSDRQVRLVELGRRPVHRLLNRQLVMPLGRRSARRQALLHLEERVAIEFRSGDCSHTEGREDGSKRPIVNVIWAFRPPSGGRRGR